MVFKLAKEKHPVALRALRWACSILWWCFIILLCALLLSIIGAKMKGKVPSVFGYSVLNIVSGSMEDEIPRGSYILVKKVDAEEIRRGDIICFYSTDPKIYGMPNTHRVAEDPIVTDSGIEFVTRGDANPVNDKETAKSDRLVGIYVKKLDWLGSFSSFVSGNTMMIVIICLQTATIFMVFCGIIKEKKKTPPDVDDTDGGVEK